MASSTISQTTEGTGVITRPRIHRRTPTGLGKEEISVVTGQIPSGKRAAWKKFAPQPFQSKEEFERDVVRHTTTTLARSILNCDNLAACQATSLSLRDRLVLAWNKTQACHTLRDPKRVYYLSMEFLMGRALDNALLNLNVKDTVADGLAELGFDRIEDVIDEENDAALGNGGLGRLAACFLDSLATLDIPAWGYGLRYQYGIFKQKIVDGHQREVPDYWLAFENPWEIVRYDISVDVRFYGWTSIYIDKTTGRQQTIWEGGELVKAVAYDVPIPGYGHKTTNNLRLWSSKPARGFDLEKFNEGDYESSVRDQQLAETISAILYPNENHDAGKELRLKQQYFWCCASIHDIFRRFKKTKRPWSEFPNQVAIQLNDTHPTIAIVELQRLFIDIEGLDWSEAWNIVTNTFGYTNHTIMSEALEKWPVPMMQNLLPRHMQIIFDINLSFLQSVEKRFSKERDLLSRVSIIEESNPQMVRMAYLAIIGSRKVNGVAELHSDLIQKTIFKDFVRIYGPDKFTNITNGITPRRWLHQANPGLSTLIESKLGSTSFLMDLTKLKALEPYAKDPTFRKEWMAVKQKNKERLAELVKAENGVIINPDALFDIQVKRIHEYKRQNMHIFGVIHRYLYLKSLTPSERSKEVPRVHIFGGKAAPGYYIAKLIIKLINSVADVVNNDEAIGNLLKVAFIADYNVSRAEVIIPASDISEHISTAGTEASGTSNMKFVLNGGLIIGTVDGANIEIAREIGEDNIFLFGHLAENVEDLRHRHRFSGLTISPELQKVVNAIESGMFGNENIFSSIIDTLDVDWYIVSDDFDSYLDTQKLVSEAYKKSEEWAEKTILAVSRMGFFSSDRAINEYADGIWSVEPIDIDECNYQ